MGTPVSQFGYCVGMTTCPMTPDYPFFVITIDNIGLWQTYTAGETSLGPDVIAPKTNELYAVKSSTELSSHVDQLLVLAIGTTPAVSPNLNTYYWPGYQTIEMELTMSSRDAAWGINPDGMIKVFLNGTQIISVTGQTFGGGSKWASLYVRSLGWMSSLYVRDIPERHPGYGTALVSAGSCSHAYPPGTHTGPPPAYTGGFPAVSLPTTNVIFAKNFITATESEVFTQNGGFWSKNYGNLWDSQVHPNYVGLSGGHVYLLGGGSAWGALYKSNPSGSGNPPNIIEPPPEPPEPSTTPTGGIYVTTPPGGGGIETYHTTTGTVAKKIPNPTVRTALFGE